MGSAKSAAKSDAARVNGAKGGRPTRAATMQTSAFVDKLAEVERLCTTPTNGDTNLDDWMVEGNWRESSATEIAAEWDALSED